MSTASELREAAQRLLALKSLRRLVYDASRRTIVEGNGPLLGEPHQQAIELTAAVCAEKADAMEKGEQGFEEWYDDTDIPGECFGDCRNAWHAARASMQAQLDTANAEIAAFKQAAQRDGQHFMPTTLKMGISDETREVCHLHDELVCDLFVIRMEHYIEQLRADLNAANARVKELEADVYARYLAMSEVVRLLGHACTGLAHEDIAPKVKERLAALSTALADCVTLAGEVERCWEYVEFTYKQCLTDCGIYDGDEQTQTRFDECMKQYIYDKRSPAVVEAMERHKQ